MLQNPRKTLGFKKNMVYKIPPGGGGKPYPASGLVRIKMSKLRSKIVWHRPFYDVLIDKIGGRNN